NLGLDPAYEPGCSQFAIKARRNGLEGMIHGANEDWPLALVLPNYLKRMVQVRHPAGGIPHLTFSTCGQVGGLNGTNARGLTVTGTLLLDRPRANPPLRGKMHSVIVRTVLEQATDIESALESIRR